MANMICPKCKTFQEKSDICVECGVVIAKVSTEDSAEQTPTFTNDRNKEEHPSERLLKRISPLQLIIGAPIGVFCLMLFTPESHRESLQEGAQSNSTINIEHTDNSMDSPESLTMELEVIHQKLEPILRRVQSSAKPYNINIDMEDIIYLYETGINLVNQEVFRPLHISRHKLDQYPLRERRESLFRNTEQNKGAYKCRTTTGWAYTNEQPWDETFSECWIRQRFYDQKHAALSDTGTDINDATQRARIFWQELSWDQERNRWDFYTQDEERTVHRAMVSEAEADLRTFFESKSGDYHGQSHVDQLNNEIAKLKSDLASNPTDPESIEYQISSKRDYLRKAIIELHHQSLLYEGGMQAIREKKRELL